MQLTINDNHELSVEIEFGCQEFLKINNQADKNDDKLITYFVFFNPHSQTNVDSLDKENCLLINTQLRWSVIYFIMFSNWCDLNQNLSVLNFLAAEIFVISIHMY